MASAVSCLSSTAASAGIFSAQPSASNSFQGCIAVQPCGVFLQDHRPQKKSFPEPLIASGAKLPFLSTNKCRQSRRGRQLHARKVRQVSASHSTPGGGEQSASGGSDGSGSLVDANLWKLQKRIEMVRMEELSTCAPTEWEDWEKHFYAGWCLQVSHILLSAQSHLLAVRPSFVLPVLSLAMVVTPTLALLCAASGFDQFVDAVRASCVVDISGPVIDTAMS